MSSWGIKNIDLEVEAVDRNLLKSREYGMTTKINAAGKQRNRKCAITFQVAMKGNVKQSFQTDGLNKASSL